MSAIDFSAILTQMLNAAKTALADKWPVVETIATSSFKTLAQSLVDIGDMLANKTINDAQAKLLFDIQKNSTTMVLLSVEVVGIVAAENAVNAALGVIKDVVNTAAKFTLL